jgi:hypothetical protein
MLLATEIKTNDIVTMKLITGDEVIAKVVNVDSLTIVVTKPLTMGIARDPRNGQPGIQMAPFWMLGADNEQKFPISKNNIVCMVKASSDAVKGYTAHTSGLAIPSGSDSSSLLT